MIHDDDFLYLFKTICTERTKADLVPWGIFSQSTFRPGPLPAHTGGLPYVGIRASSPGRTDRTKPVTVSIEEMLASNDGWEAEVSFEGVMLQESAERFILLYICIFLLFLLLHYFCQFFSIILTFWNRKCH